MKEFMFFQVGHLRFCLALPFIKSVYRISDISETPEKEALEKVIGEKDNREKQDYFICILDGRQMPLYDFSVIFDVKQSAHDPEFQKVIRIELDTHALALRVDHIDGVEEIMEDMIVPLPAVIKGKTLEWFPHVLKYEGELVPVLNPWGMSGIKSIKDDEENIFNDKLDKSDKLDIFFLSMINPEHFVNIFTISLRHVLERILSCELKNIKALLGKNE